MNINKNNNESVRKGYLFEVDISYPIELHDKFREYPPLCEHGKTTNEMLTDYQIKLKLSSEGKTDVSKLSQSNDKKLLCTLYDKKRYVVHYSALQQALELGMKLDKVHRVVEFNESKCMKDYI